MTYHGRNKTLHGTQIDYSRDYEVLLMSDTLNESDSTAVSVVIDMLGNIHGVAAKFIEDPDTRDFIIHHIVRVQRLIFEVC